MVKKQSVKVSLISKDGFYIITPFKIIFLLPFSFLISDIKLNFLIPLLFFLCYCILARDCGPLLAPYNGSSIGRDTKFPNTISFYCDVGFIMIGSQTRRCKPDGSWSGNATSCKGNICTLYYCMRQMLVE